MTLDRAFLTACLAAIILFGGASPVSARVATADEVRDLAERALNDPRALAELRSIDRVDGVPTDLDQAIGDGDAGDLESRLRTLGGPAVAQRSDAVAARTRASRILDERRFHGAQVPRPFKGVLESAGRRFDDWFSRLSRHVPGGDAALWTVISAAVFLLAVFVATRLGRRRRRASSEGSAVIDLKRERPADIERRAREAEERGEFATAIRLRFHAGLLRLDAVGALEWRASMTAGQVRRSLSLPQFDQVAVSYERVAYGASAPTDADVETSKTGWHRVLEEVGR